MVGQRESSRRSRGLLAPVVGGIVLIGCLVAAIAFRAELWQFIKWLGGVIGDWFTEWVPNHLGETGAIIGFAVVAFVINWLAHVRGRLRSWIFAFVVEVGLWLLFWYGLFVPSLNELLGLDITMMSAGAVALSGAVVVALTGAVFWFLELREEWHKYQRRHHVDEE